MGISVCPAAVVAAPLELVWANLVQWERYGEWTDVGEGHPVDGASIRSQ